MRITRGAGLRTGAAALALLAAGMMGGGAALARPAEQAAQAVSIVDFGFTPVNLTVAPGTTVTWTNMGGVPHTTSSDDGAWDSGTRAPGQSFSFTFRNGGSFTYHCNIHPVMSAVITVQGATAPVATGTPSLPRGGQAFTTPGAAPAAPPRTGTGSPLTAGLPLAVLVPALMLVLGMPVALRLHRGAGGR
jgi:plastocyanin